MNLKSSTIKQLLNEIIEEEKEKHGLTFDFHYVGKLSYVKNINKIYKKKLKLVEKKEQIKGIMYCNGFHDRNHNMVVVYKNIKQIKLCELTELIYNLYHEIGHAKDEKPRIIDISEYNNLIFFIDRCLLPTKSKYYSDSIYHDSLGYEILADMYAVKMTRKFFEKHPEIEFNEKFLNEEEKDVNEHYETYDLAQRIDEIINEGHYIYIEQDIRKRSPFSIFLKEDGSFKHIDDILKNPDFHELDQRIVNGFLKSENFKKSLLDSDISQESQKYLTNLYEKMKPKKLIIQKQEKYKDIKDVIKKYKSTIAMSLVAYILLLVEWVMFRNEFQNNQKNYNFIELLNTGFLGILVFNDIMIIKTIINEIKNKYNFICSVSEEEIDEFIDILEQKKLENNGKSL